MALRVPPLNQRVRTILFALLCALLPACTERSGNTGADHERPLVIGFSPIVSWGGWSGANANSVRNAARAAGMELRMEDSRYRQENQVALLRSFVTQRVDVIILSPVVESGWDLVLSEVRSAGIPVILLDRNIEVSDESLYASLIGSDFVEEGRRAGRWLLEHTRDVPGDIAILELRGSDGSAPANDRKLGFAQTIARDRRYRIVHSESGDFFRARAREITARFLARQSHRVHVIFAHNDGMALGGIDAVEAAGLEPGSDVLVLAIEGSRQGLEAIVAGKLNVSVEVNPLVGPQLIAIAKDAASGKPVPRRVVTRETVFTRENAAAELAKRAY
ncbi:MAG TPA: ABC transporter substrate-binding protein [Steroidobacteraceae bacterium]|nr:ABC transporter substrate-binding protein [Steroidobacteraceae bacterium]